MKKHVTLNIIKNKQKKYEQIIYKSGFETKVIIKQTNNVR